MKKIKIKVNGKFKTVLNNSKLSDLLKNLNIPIKKVAIEHNQEIIDKKKINRIKEVKRSDGFPVYEGKTSIQVTVNREDAGCGKGKAKTTQIQCDGKGNRSRQEIHLGELRLKNKEHIYEYAVYFDESYKSLEKGAVVVIGQMHTDNKADGCHNCCHFWMQDTKYKGENNYTKWSNSH